MIQQVNEHTLISAAELGVKLWGTRLEEQISEFAAVVASEDTVLFVECDGYNVLGFAQCRIRTDYLEGGDGSPVGYLDGIYVEEEHRRRGIGTKLLNACEEWAKENGCTQFTSDAETSNQISVLFHDKAGFSEVGHIICYAKPL